MVEIAIMMINFTYTTPFIHTMQHKALKAMSPRARLLSQRSNPHRADAQIRRKPEFNKCNSLLLLCIKETV